MNRVLKMLVYGVIACAQLAVTLFLIDRYAHSAPLALPAQAPHTIQQGLHPLQKSTVSSFSALSFFISAESVLLGRPITITRRSTRCFPS